jgi:hypothetical protein
MGDAAFYGQRILAGPRGDTILVSVCGNGGSAYIKRAEALALARWILDTFGKPGPTEEGGTR